MGKALLFMPATPQSYLGSWPAIGIVYTQLEIQSRW